MPLLRNFIESMDSTNRISANVRYCDCPSHRHTSGGNTCSYVISDITALVPEEQKHTRLRSGLNCSHYSFNAVRRASLLTRISKRFESIENDRQESMVDILNNINERAGDSSDLLRMIVTHIDSEGTVSKLLKTIADAFKVDGSMSDIKRNTGLITDYTSSLMQSNNKLLKDLNGFHSESKTFLKNTFDRIIEQNVETLESIKEMNRIGNEMNNKLSSIAESMTDKCLAPVMANDRQEVNNSIKQILDLAIDNRIELEGMKQNLDLSSVQYEIQLLGTLFEKNSLEIKRELIELKQELIEIKDEISLTRDAITDILPNKLIDAFKVRSDCFSDVSDIELIEDEQRSATDSSE